MTDPQLYFVIGIPSALFALNFLAVLAAAFWQAKRSDDMKDLFKAEIGRVDGSLKGEMSSLRSDLQRVEGVLSAKLDALTARVKAVEDEIRSPLVKR